MNPKPRLPLSAEPDKQAKIIEGLAIGISTRVAARLFGLHPNTLRRFIRNNPHFHAHLQQARADVRRHRILTIFNVAKTDRRAAAWLIHHPMLHRRWLRELSPGTPFNHASHLPLAADPHKQAKILDYLAIGASPADVALAFELHPDVLERFIRDNPDFHARLTRARRRLTRDPFTRFLRPKHADPFLRRHQDEYRRYIAGLSHASEPPPPEQGAQ